MIMMITVMELIIITIIIIFIIAIIIIMINIGIFKFWTIETVRFPWLPSKQ